MSAFDSESAIGEGFVGCSLIDGNRVGSYSMDASNRTVFDAVFILVNSYREFCLN